MDYMVYLIFRGFVALVQALPERTAYAVGRGLLWLARVLRVRVNVVKKNLRLCFPELSDKERMILLKKNYSYTGEMVVETILLSGWSEEEAKKRLDFSCLQARETREGVDETFVAWSGHWGCMDFGSIFAQRFQIAYAYKKIKNPYIDKWLYNLRSRWGCKMVQHNQVKSFVQRGVLSTFRALFLIADQKPGRNNITVDFFRNALSFAVGPELFAKRYKMPMVYMRMERVKPGYYKASFIELKKTHAEFGDRTQQAVALLEADIKKNPEYYFWMHNRFKHIDG